MVRDAFVKGGTKAVVKAAGDTGTDSVIKAVVKDEADDVAEAAVKRMDNNFLMI